MGRVAASLHVRFGNAVFQRLKQRGYYVRRPDLVKASYQALGLLVALAGLPARETFYMRFGANAYVTLAASILSGAVLSGRSRAHPADATVGSSTELRTTRSRDVSAGGFSCAIADSF
jgi:hypothetical protein